MTDNIRFLHIENDPLDSEMVRVELRKNWHNCDYVLASSEEELTRLLMVERFDVILADYSLPGYDGLSALSYVLQISPETPFIFVSGTMGEELAISTLKRGATDYVLKTQISRLIPSIERALTEASERANRLLAEAQLVISEAELKSVTDNLPDIISRFDHDHRHTFINQAVTRVTGIPVSEYLGKTNRELGLPEELVKIWDEKLAAVFNAGEEQKFEFLYEALDGLQWFESRLVPEFARDGIITFVLSIVKNITARKLYEIEIQRNYERLELMQELNLYHASSVQDLLDFALNKVIALSESSIGYIYHYDEGTGEFILNTWSKNVMPACTVAEPQSIYQLEKTGLWGEVVRQRKPLILNDFEEPHPLRKGYPEGHVPLSRFMSIPITVDDRIVAVVGVANKKTDYDQTDLLQLSLMMEGVWKVKNKLELEERILHAGREWQKTFDSINDSITLIDTDQRVVRCNTATKHLLGREFADIINKPCWELFHGLDEPAFDCPFVKAITSLHSETSTIYQDNKWLEVTIDPLLSDKGLLTGAVHIVRDVTERIHAEEEKLLLEQQFQQTQKLESLGVLAGGIAHDFNNILTVILCNCSLMQKRPQIAAELISEIEVAAERAADLCRQMLVYAGKAQPVPTNINVLTLVDEMVKMLKATIPQNVIIRQLPSTDIPVIKADASQIRQIVMNLIINASEAIGTSQGEIRVSLDQTAVSGKHPIMDYLGNVITPDWYVCLEVTDNGCGMDEESKRRIFEPFYTTKITGRGLGMSAVLGIIKSHNGALQLFSERGQGTTFKVYLPVKISEFAHVESIRQTSLIQWQGNGTILLVEDEPPVSLVATMLLKALGFSVIEAANGKEALELYQKNAEYITLVMTDIGMPVMDGYELFRELKKLDSKLPIIISSGFCDSGVASQIPREDLAGILSKPYNYDQLREVLKRVTQDVKGPKD